MRRHSSVAGGIVVASLGACLLGIGALASRTGAQDAASEAAQAAAPATSAEAAPAATRGRTPLSAPHEDFGYTKKWALIVGINYEGRSDLTDVDDRLALPNLKNAVQDAQTLAALLISHYGYDRESVFLLTEQEATNERIRDLVGQLKTELAQPDDSVLVFFAGHGVRIDGDPSERAAIYPYDVQLARGKPSSRYIKLHEFLFKELRDCPARHKLLILDSCYSGEIFNLGFQPRSETDDRSDVALFRDPCIQAMASCRASQVASDGTGPHSPFTQALIDGLQRLPARDRTTRLWANRLFAYMRPRVRQDTGQNPDCRNLEGDGEFYFFPDYGPTKDKFDEFANKVGDFRMLQATVASEQGNWWFKEMPWFIPSLREKILEKDSPTRASLYAANIQRSTLLKLAADTAREYDQKSKSEAVDSLEALRNKHLLQLLKADKKRAELQGEFKTIEVELTAAAIQPKLKAADWHLLAVVQHVLDREEARKSYEQAVKAYTHDESTEEGRAGATKALHALCLADFGEYLSNKQLHKEAAECFQQAGLLFDVAPSSGEAHSPTGTDASKADRAPAETSAAAGGGEGQVEAHEQSRHVSDAPPAFRIFILCREADAWLNENRWALANRRLQDARDAAEEFDTQHFLAAYVHSRRAWGEMTQWKIADAKNSFSRSNAILRQIINSDNTNRDETEKPQLVPADQRPTLTENATVEAEVPCDDDPTAETCYMLSDVFRRSTQHYAKVAFFHNVHGLAMAQRFQGQSSDAAKLYRRLLGEIELALARLRTADDRGDDTAEATLLDRVTNSQERLGDCELFGPPETRDLKEAFDDYRRALNRAHLLASAPDDRNRQRADLLYKQALVLSLDSPIRDLPLAKVMCAEADALYRAPRSQTSGKATGKSLALGELTAHVLAVIDARPDSHAHEGAAPAAPVTTLREALLKFRDDIGQNPTRDVLEMCLFAARTLVEGGDATDPFHWNEDADLLVSFCRLALDPYRSGVETATAGTFGEARAYLRPYYDAAMRCKLANSSHHVKDLLEIQWEATRGSYFVKPEQTAPTLATYVIDDKCYLLFDLPGPQGVSKCISLAETYDVPSIVEACYFEHRRLPLPNEAAHELKRWRASLHLPQDERLPQICCYWEDPVRIVLATKPVLGDDEPISVRTTPNFPFRLPAEFVPATAAASPVQQASTSQR